MVILVSTETVLLVLLVVLVAGLLRSHAELLRRLGPDRTDAAGGWVPPAAHPPSPQSRERERPAPAISGTTLDGDPCVLDLAAPAAQPVLLAFLTSGCGTCHQFWEALGREALPGAQTVIIARGSERERPASLRELAPAGTTVIVSSAAWQDYEVPGSPYFVLADGVIRGEGVASTWTALRSLVSDALADAGYAGELALAPARARRVDEVLAAAGVRPGDASLYPGGGRTQASE